MITITSANFDFTGRISGYFSTGLHDLLYTTSKTMLRLERQDQQTLTIFAIRTQPLSGEWVTYYTDPNGVLEIPLKHVVNVNEGNGTMQLDINMVDVGDGSTLDTFSETYSILPGIDEREACIPIKEDADAFNLSQPSVLPPNVIINPTTVRGSSAVGTIVEAGIQNTGAGYVWTGYAGGTGTVITPTGTRNNQIVIPAAADLLDLTNGVTSKKWRLDKPDKCTELVCIRWTSLTGAVRQHYFPIMSFNTGSDKDVSLLSPGDGYEVRRNCYNGVTCRLTGLTSYGYWYYMDLLRASDVYAVIQSTSIPWVPVAQEAAYVEGNSASTPSGSGFFSFEFTLKMKHYDTI